MKARLPPKSFFLAKVTEKFSLMTLNASVVKLRARDVVDLLNGSLSVFDGIQQIFALSFEKAVTRDSLVVLFKGHHIDWTHSFEALLQRAGFLFFSAGGRCLRCV